MRSIDPTSARLFLAVVEEGSIARAAAREHIVPSAISRRLAELEGQFGVALVERNRRGVIPTPAGEALTHHARMIQRATERMNEEMTEYLKGIRGHVRVRASASSLTAGLPSQLQSFMRAYKRVRLDRRSRIRRSSFGRLRRGARTSVLRRTWCAMNTSNCFPIIATTCRSPCPRATRCHATGR